MTECGVYTVEQAAQRLGWSRATAYRRIADGSFPVPVIRRGRLTRVPCIPLDQLLAGEAVAS